MSQVVVRHTSGTFPSGHPEEGKAVGTLYLSDLRTTAGRGGGTGGSAQPGVKAYIDPGESLTLELTPEVQKSLNFGMIKTWRDKGVLEVQEVEKIDIVAATGVQTFVHNRGYRPFVTLYDSTGEETIPVAGPTHVDENTVTVDVGGAPFTGFVLIGGLG